MKSISNRKKTFPGIIKKTTLVSMFLFSMASFSVHAAIDHNLDKIAYTPHHIKPNMPLTAPSGFSPALIKVAYGLNLISQQGAGQTIGIIDAYDNPNAESDLGVFSSTFGLPACTTANGCFSKVYASGSQPSGDTGWGLEMSLDVQWAHAIAPLAKIMLVEAADASLSSLLTAIQVAVQRGANVISMSWGAGEFSTESSYDSYFNVPNVSFTASSGDSGSGVIWPSASAYVIGTGGTSLTTTSSGSYVSETAWSGSGGGISAYVARPSYQANYANKNNPNNMRGIPDVSSVSDPNTGLSVYDSYGYGGWLVVGGTSAAAPFWAGVIAVTNSAAASKLPSLNTLLYQAATTSYSTAYHDITSGGNGSCGAVCNAGPGYDYVTGLGTPQSPNLVKIITGGGGSCVRSNPTISYSPNTTQTIQQNASVTINFQIRNNDSTACSGSNFSMTTTTSSSLIKSALSNASFALAPQGTATGYMIIKASNVAVIGQTYSATATLKDAANSRSTSFTSQVLIGNPLRK